jgi:hypothetical protein
LRRFGAALFADDGAVGVEVVGEEGGMMYMVVLLAVPMAMAFVLMAVSVTVIISSTMIPMSMSMPILSIKEMSLNKRAGESASRR